MIVFGAFLKKENGLVQLLYTVGRESNLRLIGSAILLQVTLTMSAHSLLRNLLEAAVGGPHMQKQKHPADTTG